MAQFHPAWLEHQRKRFTRPDGARYLRPQYAHLEANQADGRKANPVSTAASQDQEISKREFVELRALQTELKWQLALGRFSRKYRPDQPRNDHGRWVYDGGRRKPAPNGGVRLYAAGMPRIPTGRPPDSRDRTAIAKSLVAWAMAAGKGIATIDRAIKGTWLEESLASVKSYFEQPRTLEELQENASTPQPGYDRHHIVEQTAAELFGYPRSKIDAPDNLVLIPRMRHWEINAWFQTENASYGDMTPRDYLVGKDWDERTRVGLEALRMFRVLKP